MPVFYVNDKPVEFSEGETILPAVLRSGIKVPHYCYHPGLQITAQCRQCLVEVTDMGNGRPMPKLAASCCTPAAENMRVETASPKAVEGQKLVNEFLLVNHPLDCPICDQAGECDLQDYAYQFGSGHSEMEYEKRVYGWRNVGSFIVLERNRCVQCSRCERFSRDVEGSFDFGAFLRTHELTFDTFDDAPITHKFQGNLADICPVGCIMERHWRFKKRAWKLEKTPSVCTLCSTGCNVKLEHHDNRVFRIKPRENQEVNRWWMCDEGRLNYTQLNNRRNRYIEPLARVRGELRSATWDAIYKAIAHKLQELGATGDDVVALTDTHATNEELYLLGELMREGFASERVFYPHRAGEQQETPPPYLEDTFLYTLITTDKSPNTAGARRAGLTGDAKDDAARKALQKGPKAVFVLGDPFEGDEGLRTAAQQAGLIVSIGCFESGWSEVADVILPGYTYAEKYGTFLNKAERLQRIEPALRPPEGARDQVRILAELAGMMGKGRRYADGREVLDTMGRLDGPFKGLSWDAVGDQGVSLAAKSDAAAQASA